MRGPELFVPAVRRTAGRPDSPASGDFDLEANGMRTFLDGAPDRLTFSRIATNTATACYLRRTRHG